MSTIVTGVVQEISSRFVLARGKKSPVYEFVLDDGETYRTNFTKPPFGEGDTISFKYDENDYGKNVVVKSIVIEDGTEPATPRATAKPAPKATGGLSKDAYWERKEARDLDKDKVVTYMACRNTAVAFVDLLMKNGLVTAGTTKASKQQATQLLEDLVSKYTTDFFFATTIAAINELEPSGSVSVDPDEVVEVEEEE